MTRYVGTGEGSFHGSWYVYVPSPDDRRLAREIADATVDRLARSSRRSSGSWDTEGYQPRPSWYVSGFLGETAALHPIRQGPHLESWRGEGRWRGSADYELLEIRTTSSRQLYGFALHPSKHPAGLGGWRVTAKDAGRILVCVEERQDDLAVHGWIEANKVQRLPAAVGNIVAVVEPPELLPLAELYHLELVP